MTAKRPVLGILGGMGPLATIDFLSKIIDHTDAVTEQDHIPLRIEWRPDTPPRPAFLEGRGEDPLPAMAAAIRRLSGGDDAASAIVIAVNTVHYWFDALQAETDVPILHIAEATFEGLGEVVQPGSRLGILGTDVTMQHDIFDSRAVEAGFELLKPDAATQAGHVLPAIVAVKHGDLAAARDGFLAAIDHLAARGAVAVIAACTEIPVVIPEASVNGIGIVDPSGLLARKAVNYIRQLEKEAQA